jgi:hypothetical protein
MKKILLAGALALAATAAGSQRAAADCGFTITIGGGHWFPCHSALYPLAYHPEPYGAAYGWPYPGYYPPPYGPAIPVPVAPPVPTFYPPTTFGPPQAPYYWYSW